MEAVTTVLLDRAREPSGLRRMVAWSLAGHVVFVTGFVLLPRGAGPSDTAAFRSVMTVSLAGPAGPRSGGMTPIGGRPIQAVVPLPDLRRPSPLLPAAPRQPEMTLPARTPRKPPASSGQTATRAARAASTGTAPREGTSRAETGATGIGLGLSTGGGGVGAAIDVGGFCCPEYLGTMVQLIQRNWNSRQEVPGETVVRFTVQRDGTVANIELARSSGYMALDLSAQRALHATQRLPPLPAEFPEAQLTVNLRFQYRR